VLLALFLWAGHTNALTSLSLVAGNQVRVICLIQLKQPISDPMNEPSRKLICKPTNDQTTNEVRPSSTSNTFYTFEAVNCINTSYSFEAANGVNAKPFEAVNGVSHVHVKNIVVNQLTFGDGWVNVLMCLYLDQTNSRCQNKSILILAV
jgi:hypothetical protein